VPSVDVKPMCRIVDVKTMCRSTCRLYYLPINNIDCVRCFN